MKNLIFALALALGLFACEGPSGSSGTVGETGATGDPGMMAENGPAGESGNAGPAGESGNAGPAGPPGADGTPCAVVDNEDGTYTLNCPGQDPVLLHAGNPGNFIEGTYTVAGEPGAVSLFTLYAFVASGQAVALDVVVSDAMGHLRMELPNEDLLAAGRLFLVNEHGHGSALSSDAVVVDEISSQILEVLRPFYAEAPAESAGFDAMAINAIDTAAREAADNAMDTTAAVLSSLRILIPATLMGSMSAQFHLGHPFLRGHVEQPLTEDNLRALVDDDRDLYFDEGFDLITAEGGIWDPMPWNAGINDGGNDTFDDAMILLIGRADANDFDGFEITEEPTMIGLSLLNFRGAVEVIEEAKDGSPAVSVNVSREILLNLDDTADGHWIRYTDVISNPTDSELLLDVLHVSEVADSGETFGPQGDDWHTSVEYGNRGLPVGFYYPDADAVEFDDGDVVLKTTVAIPAGGSVTLRSWLFKAPIQNGLTVDDLATEIAAVRDGSVSSAVLSSDESYTSISGSVGSAGPGSNILVTVNATEVTTTADHLGRVSTTVVDHGAEATVVIDDGDAVVLAVPDVDECAVDNGGCGLVAHAECVNQPYMAPVCNDLDACLVGVNGGCGDINFVTCVDQPNGQPALCEDVSECAVNNGGCGDLHCLELLAAENECTDLVPGIQQNVPMANFTDQGFQVCHRADYAARGSLDDILDGCVGNEMVIGCLPNDADVFTLAAGASRIDVLMDVGNGREASNEVDGVAWYYNDDHSWGFAPAGLRLNRNTCDTNNDGDNGETRMCWHTNSGNFNGGYRCGSNTSSNGIQRVILVR